MFYSPLQPKIANTVLSDDGDPRPFLKWVGGKGQLLGDLRNRIPENYGTYFEPFVGGGAVFFSESPTRAMLLDINSELVNAYSVVRDDVDGLIKELHKHRYEEEHYYKVRNADRLPSYSKWNAAKRAARLIFLNKTCLFLLKILFFLFHKICYIPNNYILLLRTFHTIEN